MSEENTAATERELDLCGYFVIVTSDIVECASIKFEFHKKIKKFLAFKHYG